MNNKLNKKDLVDKISAKTRISKNDTTMMLNACLDIIKESLQNGDIIALHNFGTFQQQPIKSKIGRDIRKNEEIIIPPRKKIKFIPCKELKNINNQ